MGHTIGFKVDTISPERRDKLLSAVIELMNTELGGADELVLTYTTEEQVGGNTKKKTTFTHKWTPGQGLPSLRGTFGIQTSMFGDMHTMHQPSAGLEVFRRTIEDLERERGYGDDDDTEHTT